MAKIIYLLRIPIKYSTLNTVLRIKANVIFIIYYHSSPDIMDFYFGVLFS